MAVVPFAGQQNLWLVRLLYSLVFFGLAFLVAQHPDKLSQVARQGDGPLLLVMIVVLFAACLFAKHPGFANPQGSYAHHQLMQGFIDGYQTMDLLAASISALSISANISSMGVEDEHDNRAETGIGGIFTGIMLAIIYAMLGFVGAVSGSYQAIDGATDTGATVLTNLTDRLFGHVGTMFVGLIFNCGLLQLCAPDSSPPVRPTSISSSAPCLATGVGPSFSHSSHWSLLNIGLSAIIKLSVPVLEALYPIAIVLVLLSLLHGVFTRHFPAVYFWTVLFTAIDSVANGIANLVAAFGGRWYGSRLLCNWLPLNSVALGWVVPALAGFVVGIIVSIAERMHTH